MVKDQEPTVQPEGAESSESPPPELESIDFEKYQTAELTDQIIDLVSVPHVIKGFLWSVFEFVVAHEFFVFIVYFIVLDSVWHALMFLAVYFFISIPIGALLGVLLIIRKSFKNIESILLILLNTTTHVAADYDDVSAGNRRLPSGPELVEQVYQKVMLPVLDRVINKVFHKLAIPVTWAYHLTLGAAVNTMISQMKKLPSKESKTDGLEANFESGFTMLAKSSEKVQWLMNRATSIVSRIGWFVQFFATIPVAVVLLISICFALLPLLVIM
jgi:hypothetical protein